MQNLIGLTDIAYQPSTTSSGDFTLSTSLKCDYACIAIWNGALYKQTEIREDLERHFDILADYEITWSKTFYGENIERLYERPKREVPTDGWDRKIGPPPFRFFIVRDANPRYTWKRSVSGVIEPANEAVVAAKYRYRDLFPAKYQVHSSNNIEEFLFQSTLILGPERLQAVLKGPILTHEVLHKDLEGAGGWDSWKQLFDVLNIGSKYLVLRNFEGLPHQLLDQDIDFLCDNYQRLASLCGIKQNSNIPYKGSMIVNGTELSVDIRFTGDKYFPAAWQETMLRRRQPRHGFYVPAPDDLFFSVLFHCKVQKLKVKSKYVTDLTALARDLRFDWFDGTDLADDFACGRILNGYMRARGFQYEAPLDRGVKQNMLVIDMLPLSSCRPGEARARTFREKLILAIRHPRKARDFLLKNVKTLAKKLTGL